MALLNPPNPAIPQRQYRIRLDEPLALMMDRYIEFLGAPSADHVIAEALAFIFKKDSEFKQWLGEHREPDKDSQSEAASAKPNRTGAAREMAKTAATAGDTI